MAALMVGLASGEKLSPAAQTKTCIDEYQLAKTDSYWQISKGSAYSATHVKEIIKNPENPDFGCKDKQIACTFTIPWKGVDSPINGVPDMRQACEGVDEFTEGARLCALNVDLITVKDGRPVTIKAFDQICVPNSCPKPVVLTSTFKAEQCKEWTEGDNAIYETDKCIFHVDCSRVPGLPIVEIVEVIGGFILFWFASFLFLLCRYAWMPPKEAMDSRDKYAKNDAAPLIENRGHSRLPQSESV
jgi:hypothetical protein